MVPGAKDRKELVTVGVDPLYRREFPRGCEVALTWHVFGKIDGQKSRNETLQKIQDVCDWWHVMTTQSQGSRLRNKGSKTIEE